MRRLITLTIFLQAYFLCIGQDSLNYYLSKGDSLQAIFEDAKSYVYYDSASQLAIKNLDIPNYVRTLIGKGYALRFDFDNPNYDGAFQYLFEALSLSRNNDLISMEQKQRIYYGLAITERERLNYDQAKEYGELAIIMASRLGDKRLIAKCNSMMGNIHSDERNYDDAIRFIKNAITIRLSEKPTSDRDLAFWYSNLGLTYKRANDPSRSNQAYLKSIKWFESLDPYDSAMIRDNHQNMAANHVDLGEMTLAKHYYNLASGGDVSISGKGYSVSRRNMLLGQMYRKFDQKDSSLFFLQKSLKTGLRNFNPTSELQNPEIPTSDQTLNPQIYLVLNEKGDVLLDLYSESGEEKYLISSYEVYELAASVIADLRFGLEDNSPSLHLAEHAKEIYSNALRATLLMHERDQDPGFIESALKYIEGIKQSILLRNRMIDNQVGKLKEFQKEVMLLQKDIDDVRQQIQLAKIEESSGYQNIEALISKVILLRSEKDLIEEDARIENTIENNVKSVGELQDYLEDHQLMINYFWGSESLYGLAISKAGSYFLELNTEGLDDYLDTYIRTVSTVDFDSGEQSFQQFVESSSTIYNAILEPFLSTIEGESNSDIQELIIVPDGRLNMLPFASLISEIPDTIEEINYKNLSYLIRDYTISYAFSASILALKSNIDYKFNRVLGFSSMELAGTQNELSRIESVWKKMDIFNSEVSTEDNFKRHAPDYNIIHIASHASSGDDVFEPNIAFAKGEDASNDGRLHAYEIYPMKLNNKLTVLSACETGLGTFYDGEGVFSIARGFALAGSSAIVTSLWKVRDLQTVELMTNFYSELNQGSSISNSLRSSQLEYLANGNFVNTHPHFWSSFIVLGDGSSILFESQKSIYWTVIILISLSIIIYIYRRKRSTN